MVMQSIKETRFGESAWAGIEVARDDIRERTLAYELLDLSHGDGMVTEFIGLQVNGGDYELDKSASYDSWGPIEPQLVSRTRRPKCVVHVPFTCYEGASHTVSILRIIVDMLRSTQFWPACTDLAGVWVSWKQKTSHLAARGVLSARLVRIFLLTAPKYEMF